MSDEAIIQDATEQLDSGSDRSPFASGTAASQRPTAVYDAREHKWHPKCPYGDICTGCDALGYCTRARLVLPAENFPAAESVGGTPQTAQPSLQEVALDEIDAWKHAARTAQRSVGRLEEALRDALTGLETARDWVDSDRLDAIDHHRARLREAAELALSDIDEGLASARAALVRTGEEHGPEQEQKGDAPVPGASGTAPTQTTEVEG